MGYLCKIQHKTYKKIAQRVLKICQSGKISPNLVALLVTTICKFKILDLFLFASFIIPSLQAKKCPAKIRHQAGIVSGANLCKPGSLVNKR